MIDPIEILMEHVLLTSRGGLAACAAEHCEWEDKFHPSRGLHDPLVPMHIRLSHAVHQHEMLEKFYSGQGVQAPESTPRAGW